MVVELQNYYFQIFQFKFSISTKFQVSTVILRFWDQLDQMDQISGEGMVNFVKILSLPSSTSKIQSRCQISALYDHFLILGPNGPIGPNSWGEEFENLKCLSFLYSTSYTQSTCQISSLQHIPFLFQVFFSVASSLFP